MAFKMKKVLKESGEEKKAKKLNELLTSGNWYNDTPLFYRGTSHDIETWIIRDKREERVPLDTEQDIHMLVSVVGSVFYPNLPDRNSSYFVATDPRVASDYGEVHFAFPHQNSKVGGIYGDSFLQYFQSADVGLAMVEDEMSSVYDTLESDETLSSRYGSYVDDWVINLLEILYEIRKKDKSRFGKIGDILRRFEKLKKVRKRLKNISRELLEDPNLKFEIRAFQQFAKAIEQASDLFYQFYMYFDELWDGVGPYDEEVLIDGKFILANVEFVKKYFKLPSGESETKLKLK